jgi:hypothetical protein
MEFHDEKFELPSGKWWRIMLQLSENLRNLVFEREPGASGRGGGTAAPAGATRPHPAMGSRKSNCQKDAEAQEASSS